MEIGMLASCHVARALRCKLQCACYDLRTPVPCTVDALVYFIWYVSVRKAPLSALQSWQLALRAGPVWVSRLPTPLWS